MEGARRATLVLGLVLGLLLLPLLLASASCSAPAPEPLSVGRVKTGAIVWSLVAVEDLPALFVTGGHTAGETSFIRVEARLENLERQPVRVTGATLVDGAGNRYPSLTFTNALEEEEACAVRPLVAGAPLTCVWIFEVPTTVQGLRLLTTDLSPAPAWRDSLALIPQHPQPRR